MTAIDITALTDEQKAKIAADFAASEKAKKEKGSKGEDTQKLAYENELNNLKTALDKEKNEYSNQTKWLELDRQNNLISLQDYFNQKNKLDDEDYQAQLEFINKSINAAEKQIQRQADELIEALLKLKEIREELHL